MTTVTLENAKSGIELFTYKYLKNTHKDKKARVCFKDVLDYYKQDDAQLVLSITTVEKQLEKLIECRDAIVDANEHFCIFEIVRECCLEHNAKMMKQSEDFTETEIAQMFDEYIWNTVRQDVNYRSLSCSLEVFATISDNADAVSFFEYHMSDDDNRITYDLLSDYMNTIDIDNNFCDLEDIVNEMRCDYQRLVNNKEWESLEDYQERITIIADRLACSY